VYALGTTGVGGGACAGTTFTITETAPGSGTFVFSSSAPVVLGVGEVCTVDFMVTTLRTPSVDQAPAQPGVTTRQVATATANSPIPGVQPRRSSGSDSSAVFPAGPTIVTQVAQVSPPAPAPAPGTNLTVPAGTVFTDTDTATVTGVGNGPTPTGTATFTVFFDAPGAPPCSGPATVLGPVPVSGPAPTPPVPPTASATSPPVTAATVGTYRFIAAYSGDANYPPLTATPYGAPGENVTVTAAPVDEAVNDFDGGGTTDVAVFRPDNGTWYLRTASSAAIVWGQNGDIPVPGDYDNNGTTDLAVYRPGNNAWYVRTASPFAVVWGTPGDIPAPGDYDGNGATDLAVFRPANNAWYVRTATPFAVVWGTSGDRPLTLPDAIRRFF